MKKIFKFILKLAYEIKKNNLTFISNQLTYKLILALFPFLIFIISILGFLNLDSRIILDFAAKEVPKDIMGIINLFVTEVIDKKDAKVLSSSIFLTIWSASGGFAAIMNGINKTYNEEDKRNFFVLKIISICLVLIFTFAIIFSISILVFKRPIYNFLLGLKISQVALDYIFLFLSPIITVLLLFVTILIIFKLSSFKKNTFKSLLPGAITTVILWAISSKLFNIYIDNFSKYSKIYGSIGSIFILMIWLNLMSLFILVGSQINAILIKKE